MDETTASASADYTTAPDPGPGPAPGLDETMSDQALGAFTAGARPTLHDPPPRAWPAVAVASTVAGTVGLILGAFLTPVQVLAAVVTVIAAAVSVAWIEHRDGT